MTYLSNIVKVVVLLALPLIMACQQQPTVVLNPDLTSVVAGSYNGNYVVNYESDPGNNFSSQISLQVNRIDNNHIHVIAPGGDSFECKVSGTSNNLTFSNISNTTGVYDVADDLEGYFINGTLYYKVTGVVNGGNFYAEFTVI